MVVIGWIQELTVLDSLLARRVAAGRRTPAGHLLAAHYRRVTLVLIRIRASLLPALRQPTTLGKCLLVAMTDHIILLDLAAENLARATLCNLASTHLVVVVKALLVLPLQPVQLVYSIMMVMLGS